MLRRAERQSQESVPNTRESEPVPEPEPLTPERLAAEYKLAQHQSDFQGWGALVNEQMQMLSKVKLLLRIYPAGDVEQRQHELRNQKKVIEQRLEILRQIRLELDTGEPLEVSELELVDRKLEVPRPKVKDRPPEPA
jgi:hypothetical protein